MKLNREPTDEEVAKKAKLPLDEVMAVRDLTRVTTSLDTPVGEGDTTLGELHAESAADLEDEVLEREQEEAVGEALAKLPDAERKIIEARFGTGGRPELSIREAARALGVTQNAARELEARALARLATDGSLAGWRGRLASRPSGPERRARRTAAAARYHRAAARSATGRRTGRR